MNDDTQTIMSTSGTDIIIVLYLCKRMESNEKTTKETKRLWTQEGQAILAPEETAE